MLMTRSRDGAQRHHQHVLGAAHTMVLHALWSDWLDSNGVRNLALGRINVIMTLLACVFCLAATSAVPARAQQSGSAVSALVTASDTHIESGREIPSTPPTRASTVFALHPLSVHEQVHADGYNAWRTGVIGITVGGVVGGVFGYLGSAYGC